MRSFHVFLTLLVFFFSCSVGFSIARQKPLWTDELRTEGYDIRPSSYWELIIGNNTEGTKAPVYNCVQKFIDQVFSYRLSDNVIELDRYQKLPDNKEGLYIDKRGQIVCRISSIIWMSLSIALIFYYFTRYTALWAGVSALLITLSTYMIWCYWAEDRAYSFWFLLTTIQSLVVLWSSQHTHKKSVVLGLLMVTNILLSLTVSLTIVQIIAVTIWMFSAGYRKITDYILTLAIPVLVCLFYYKQAPHFSYIFLFPAWKMITANIPLERIIMPFAAGLYLWKRSLQPISVQDRKGDLICLSYLGLIFAAGVGLLLVFKMREGSPSDPWGLLLNGRHLIFLAPIGIIASTFAFVRLIEVNSSKKICTVLALLLVLLTVPRIWRYDHFSYVTGQANDKNEPQYNQLLKK